ncbi:MAG TPA: hypothetical protein DCY70_18610 [Shewanella sp.]|nr:hypothetical protein [Shewanella sp.]
MQSIKPECKFSHCILKAKMPQDEKNLYLFALWHGKLLVRFKINETLLTICSVWFFVYFQTIV